MRIEGIIPADGGENEGLPIGGLEGLVRGLETPNDIPQIVETYGVNLQEALRERGEGGPLSNTLKKVLLVLVLTGIGLTAVTTSSSAYGQQQGGIRIEGVVGGGVNKPLLRDADGHLLVPAGNIGVPAGNIRVPRGNVPGDNGVNVGPNVIHGRITNQGNAKTNIGTTR